jgi:hypothetical protein
MAEMPPLPDDMRLAMLDRTPDEAPELGVVFNWLESLDWQTVAGYRDAVALDASVPHRGVAIIDVETAEALHGYSAYDSTSRSEAYVMTSKRLMAMMRLCRGECAWFQCPQMRKDFGVHQFH